MYLLKCLSNIQKNPTKLLFQNCIAAFLVIFSISFTQAAVPASINYQGFLTDDTGTPIDATHDITFRIYTVSTGGSALYTATQTIAIIDGRFDTQLGDSPNFPANLFDGTPLYLGLEINNDGEMIPRQALTSTPFAYKAQDADTLEGMTAATLDQSAHITDMANPHGVTAAQAGAASTDDLNTHTTIAGAHHVKYSDADAVAAMGNQTNANTLNHNRYTNPDAVTAMGVKVDSNPLNHDKYLDSNSVSAILAADGSGSTLDADLLDGQHAADIIDAASDEVRTPISSVPFLINRPGSYYFTQNLSHTDISSDAIAVTSLTGPFGPLNGDHVTIDMMGFALIGPGKTSGTDNSGIVINNRTNVTVMNGTVWQFGGDGIRSTGDAHRVIDVRAVNNGRNGIYLDSSNSLIRGCTAQGNGQAISDRGIFAGYGSVIINNIAADNAGNGIGGRIGATVSNNASYNNDYNGITGLGSNLIEGNTVSLNNRANSPSGAGIWVATRSRVVGNVVTQNIGSGINVAGDDTIIEGNHINSSGTGINFTFGQSARRNNTFAGNGADVSGAHTNGGGGLSF